MKISGFTMVRNAGKFYFPIKESIESILPIVDEFVIALGDCEEGDTTRAQIESIGSPKIRIIDRVWSEADFKESRILAKETNYALSQCSGDWCFYIQADEVVHEKDLETIRIACEENISKDEVDGLLFKYHHFFADYDHFLPFHGWYKNEIRIVRNNRKIKSIKDAQSFRHYNESKLSVKEIDAHIYHYGWVRPPELMQSKKKEHDTIHHGKTKTEAQYTIRPNDFDYGPLGKLPTFKGTHPQIMNEFRKKLNWQERLNYTNSGRVDRSKMKHEKLKYKIISFFENTFYGGKDIVGYTNWETIK